MAEWIPWCKGLSRKPEVLAIARDTGRSRREVACLLMEMWEWADSETENGIIDGASSRSLRDMIAGTDDAFWCAVAATGWIDVSSDDKLTIPNFDRWMGKSSKKRLRDAVRQKRRRNHQGGNVTDLSRKQRDKSVTTVQNSINTPLPPERGEKVSESEDGFAAFWAEYPRPWNESAARQEWHRLTPDAATQASILAALARLKKSESWRKNGGQYIPKPAKFLREKQWLGQSSPADESRKSTAKLAKERADRDREKAAALADREQGMPKLSKDQRTRKESP